MRVCIERELKERQGGVSTYERALRRWLPKVGVDVVDSGGVETILQIGPHAYREGDFSGVRRVIVVHDLIPEIEWKDESIREGRRLALERADAVIAVSEWTKNDLVQEYGVSLDRIRVVHHGVDHELFESRGDDFGQDFGRPYLLYVGKRNEYKRFRWFLRAVAPLMWRHPSWRIRCTGEPFCRREVAWLLALGLYGRVTVRRYDEAEMSALYRQALAFVYPSAHEGFGMPILEAMASGCPVVSSDATCLPEVGGDAADYFRADDSRGFRQCIRRLVSDVHWRSERVERGLARAKEFTWERCARETAEVLSGGSKIRGDQS